MTERQKSLVERREELLAKSAIQREQFVALVGDSWQPGALSTSRNILVQARQKPLISGLMAILAFLFFRKRSLFSLLATAVVSFKTWSELSPYIMPFLNRLIQFIQKRRQRC